ncbi:MAG: UDP-N-acetylenolpyruvoylglucosamine reductase [Candidatus Binatia bacterium]|nr:MAG: UDP-N-acetylenolpyruvoylglucosamine reductase [Candidatus Binatia bacterium]
MNQVQATTAFDQELQWSFGQRLKRNEPLARHTSFRIGGPADLWIEVESTSELCFVLQCARRHGTPWWLLGGGTNVLVSDSGVRGLVLRLGRAFSFAEWRENEPLVHVRVGASLPLKKLVLETVERNLTGLEFAEGIPGTVGGGLLMNAGAFGGELAQVVSSVELVTPDAQKMVVPREALRFDYRYFDLPRGTVVTAVEFTLRRAAPEVVQERYRNAKTRRERNQPRGYPNAGSIFKNPPGNFAGRLIEAVGLKGYRLGQAMFSTKHANFIVNLGGARAKEVRALMAEAERRVAEQFGIRLEAEIRLVGDWSE